MADLKTVMLAAGLSVAGTLVSGGIVGAVVSARVVATVQAKLEYIDSAVGRIRIGLTRVDDRLNEHLIRDAEKGGR